ncbi:zinc finger protein weckle-like isoform X1 [Glossina fuscipes]|uniref:Zinc finger protein weckle-like isoform X1 n=2 Tax=Glossina fuscipes TaxID=7396 RepID=A0A8U0WE74_9MUSC|nr:zinc finger protein weckle-like isoform X1 [Glossina fuscipes]XP_037883925.1 zinc finger protein weckle-like isoform X1 [Glossina fuscipes]XP_037883926.1 zinc finger protein weckle-like isoform X1 [Glossina fuscipes]XP_037883927.1 zinc finger protein weckle-like isoform X1 [Glossina fuscipes]XP_037883928.1 zinc finger protein weckle-like isoform X1 [Glossina fuscipes]
MSIQELSSDMQICPANDWFMWCRLCAESDTGNIKVNIFEEPNNTEVGLVSAINKYFGVKISQEDSLPKVLCTHCFNVVTAVVNLHERVVKVQQMFNALIYDSTQELDDLQSTAVFINNAFQKEEVQYFLEVKSELTEEDTISSEVSEATIGHNQKFSAMANGNEEELVMEVESPKLLQGFDADYEPEATSSNLYDVSKENNKNRMKKEKKKIKYDTYNDFQLDVKCQDCSKQLKSFFSYRQHMTSIHGKGYSEKWKCPVCNKLLVTSFSLKRHLISHNNEKNTYN